jgi:hypothetical protein
MMSSVPGVELCGVVQRELAAFEVKDGATTRITDNPGSDHAPAYSPDGRFIAFLSQGTDGFESDLVRLKLYDRQARTTVVLAQFRQDRVYIAGIGDSRAYRLRDTHLEQLTKEDLAMVLLDLECGGIAHLCASFAADDLSADPWTFMVKVIGTAGTTRYTYQDWVEAKKGISHSRVYTAYQETITNEDRYFVDVCLRGGQPLSSMDDAIIVQKTIEAVEKSIAEGVTVTIT